MHLFTVLPIIHSLNSDSDSDSDSISEECTLVASLPKESGQELQDLCSFTMDSVTKRDNGQVSGMKSSENNEEKNKNDNNYSSESVSKPETVPVPKPKPKPRKSGIADVDVVACDRFVVTTPISDHGFANCHCLWVMLIILTAINCSFTGLFVYKMHSSGVECFDLKPLQIAHGEILETLDDLTILHRLIRKYQNYLNVDIKDFEEWISYFQMTERKLTTSLLSGILSIQSKQNDHLHYLATSFDASLHFSRMFNQRMRSKFNRMFELLRTFEFVNANICEELENVDLELKDMEILTKYASIPDDVYFNVVDFVEKNGKIIPAKKYDSVFAYLKAKEKLKKFSILFDEMGRQDIVLYVNRFETYVNSYLGIQ